MKTNLFAIALAAALPLGLAAAPAVAQGAEISTDKPLYDAEGKRVGIINRVAEQKWVKVIYKDAFVTIGWDTLKIEDGKVVTSLTRKEIAKLRG
jgi:hypothetical protein